MGFLRLEEAAEAAEARQAGLLKANKLNKGEPLRWMKTWWRKLGRKPMWR